MYVLGTALVLRLQAALAIIDVDASVVRYKEGLVECLGVVATISDTDGDGVCTSSGGRSLVAVGLDPQNITASKSSPHTFWGESAFGG